MGKITRLFKSFFRLLLPVVILLTLAFVDSVPSNSDELLASVVGQMCDLAASISNRQVLLIAGSDAPDFQNSTAKTGKVL
ncbi:MAG: hypothetical protein ABI891_08735 [Acidobacteriota bacterium]